jgi:hypothetical protein
VNFDVVSVAGIAGFAAAAVFFLSRPKRADDLRSRLPKWIPKRMRGRGTDDEFFPFRRWTWTVLPSHWVSALLTSVIGGMAFAVMAAWFYMRGVGLFPVPTILAMILLVQAARIMRKVVMIRSGSAK